MRFKDENTAIIRECLGYPDGYREKPTLNKTELEALADRVGAPYDTSDDYHGGSNNCDIREAIMRRLGYREIETYHYRRSYRAIDLQRIADRLSAVESDGGGDIDAAAEAESD